MRPCAPHIEAWQRALLAGAVRARGAACLEARARRRAASTWLTLADWSPGPRSARAPRRARAGRRCTCSASPTWRAATTACWRRSGAARRSHLHPQPLPRVLGGSRDRRGGAPPAQARGARRPFPAHGAEARQPAAGARRGSARRCVERGGEPGRCALWGRPGRENVRLLNQLTERRLRRPLRPGRGPSTLLERLQDDILDRAARPTPDPRARASTAA